MGAGRPSAYSPDMVGKARWLCEHGATDVEVADALNIDIATLYRWKHKHPEFCEALQVGKDANDNRIERSLYQKAAGYTVEEEEAIKVKLSDGSEAVEIVKLKKHVPPDTTSAIFWLKNRRRKDWTDSRNVTVDTTIRLEDKRTFDPAQLTDEQREVLKLTLQRALAPPPEEAEWDEVD